MLDKKSGLNQKLRIRNSPSQVRKFGHVVWTYGVMY